MLRKVMGLSNMTMAAGARGKSAGLGGFKAQHFGAHLGREKGRKAVQPIHPPIIEPDTPVCFFGSG